MKGRPIQGYNEANLGRFITFNLLIKASFNEQTWSYRIGNPALTRSNTS
jgi:hypothetical protein